MARTAMPKHVRNLPPNLEPLWIDHEETAGFLAMSTTMLDLMIRDGEMDPGFKYRGMRRWSVATVRKWAQRISDANDPETTPDSWSDQR
jgi:hypothetical protein